MITASNKLVKILRLLSEEDDGVLKLILSKNQPAIVSFIGKSSGQSGLFPLIPIKDAVFRMISG
jgi:hypothetical protein